MASGPDADRPPGPDSFPGLDFRRTVGAVDRTSPPPDTFGDGGGPDIVTHVATGLRNGRIA